MNNSLENTLSLLFLTIYVVLFFISLDDLYINERYYNFLTHPYNRNTIQTKLFFTRNVSNSGQSKCENEP